MTIDLSVLIAIIGAVLSVATFFFGRVSVAKTNGKENGMVLTEIGYIKSGIDDIKQEQREQRNINTEVLTRLTAVEESTKQAHKRISDIAEIEHR